MKPALSESVITPIRHSDMINKYSKLATSRVSILYSLLSLLTVLFSIEHIKIAEILPSVLWRCWLGGRNGIRPVKNMGDGGVGHWLVQMEWRPAGWSVYLPLLILPCTIKSRSSLLAPAHTGGPGKRAVKRLWWWWDAYYWQLECNFSVLTLGHWHCLASELSTEMNPDTSW